MSLFVNCRPHPHHRDPMPDIPFPMRDAARAVLCAVCLVALGCADGRDANPDLLLGGAAVSGDYAWERLTENAGFEPSYNFPVRVDASGRFVALHSKGTWLSSDGASWSLGALVPSGLNSAYLKYVQHEQAEWALGTLRGNYQRFTVEPDILRTSDYETWESVGSARNLPPVVFYAAASFRGRLWMLGGYDGTTESAAVWSSADGLSWETVTERAPWAPRQGAAAVVFRDRLYLIGGGVLDGPRYRDAWSTADGIEWRRETERISERSDGGSPIVFDDRLWLVGVNRDNGFSPGILVSDDGVTFTEETAPWSPRGGVAVWTDGDALYMTGGKYSEVVDGETVFIYHNDVWRMRMPGPATRGGAP